MSMSVEVDSCLKQLKIVSADAQWHSYGSLHDVDFLSQQEEKNLALFCSLEMVQFGGQTENT